jgi:hypothetical protein
VSENPADRGFRTLANSTGIFVEARAGCWQSIRVRAGLYGKHVFSVTPSDGLIDPRPTNWRISATECWPVPVPSPYTYQKASWLVRAKFRSLRLRRKPEGEERLASAPLIRTAPNLVHDNVRCRRRDWPLMKDFLRIGDTLSDCDGEGQGRRRFSQSARTCHTLTSGHRFSITVMAIQRRALA